MERSFIISLGLGLAFLGVVSAISITLPQFQNFQISSGLTQNPVNLKYALLNNIMTVVVGNSTFRVGTAAFPFDGACKLQLKPDVFGQICHHDCLDNHYSYGGACAPAPNSPDQSYLYCFCATTQEEARALNISTTYGGKSNSTTPVFGEPTDAQVFIAAVRLNMYLKQCIPPTGENVINSENCAQDCIYSHGATTGRCIRAPPLYNTNDYGPSIDGKYTFCECLYESNSTTTTTTTTEASLV